MKRTRNSRYPYHEHDACGIGFIADASGKRSHRVLMLAIEALARMAHRGAVAADGRTSDGVGLLTQIPYPLFKRELVKEGIAPEKPRDIAVGMFFFPQQEEEAERAKELVAAELEELGMPLKVWRRVPTNPEVLGEKARSVEPAIWQALLIRPRGLEEAEFERQLYRARRRIEKGWAAAGLEAYAASLSSRTLVYKGLTRPGGLLPRPGRPLLPDLAGPLSPALLDQHLPGLASGAAFQISGPERRDKHPAGQRQLDEGSRAGAD